MNHNEAQQFCRTLATRGNLRRGLAVALRKKKSWNKEQQPARQSPTTNRQATNNNQQTTNDNQQTTNTNKQQPTNNNQQTTNTNKQPPTNKDQQIPTNS